MKASILILFFIFTIGILTQPIPKDCTFKGKKLLGRVQIVEYGADFKISAVEYGEDLRIQAKSYNDSRCGNWYFVENGGDFKVQFVEYGEDFKIKFVEFGEGLP